MKHSIFSAALISATLLMPAAHAAGYLHIEDIPGESRAPGHEDWIDILSMSESVAMPDNSGAGRRTGAAQSSGITITRQMDISSPYLMNAVVRGTRFDEVTIDFTGRTPSGAVEPYYSVELRNAIITSVSTNIADDSFEEELTLQYENITWTVHGARGEEDHSTEWNRAQNTSTAPRVRPLPTQAQ